MFGKHSRMRRINDMSSDKGCHTVQELFGLIWRRKKENEKMTNLKSFMNDGVVLCLFI